MPTLPRIRLASRSSLRLGVTQLHLWVYAGPPRARVAERGASMSGKQNYRTPKWLFDQLNSLFGPFKLDAYASHENALCADYFTEKSGQGHWRDVTFANPPFKLAGFCAAQALFYHATGGVRSVLILPVGCSQRWFHKLIEDDAGILYPEKRISFNKPDGTPTKGADRDTIIVTIGFDTSKFGRQANAYSFEVAPCKK